MGKSRLRNLALVYLRPLPFTLSSEWYGPLPEIFPHNPVSWVWFSWWFIRATLRPAPESFLPNVQIKSNGNLFYVEGKDAERLWSNGFFGKGTLSRSEPSWAKRAERRLHLKAEGTHNAVEEFTSVRREERRKFKDMRALLQQLETKSRLDTLSKEEQSSVEQLKKNIEEVKVSMGLTKGKDDEEVEIDYEQLRHEDRELIDRDTGTLQKNLEVLQLEPIEVFFLNFALGVADVPGITDSKRLLTKLCGHEPRVNDDFLINYVVYHHYRSLGWCVRSGIKFGCDMLLYKRGPPFSHAEFAILIKRSTDTIDWFTMSTCARVIGAVKKNLIIVYVDVPRNEDIISNQSIMHLLQLYKVTEISYRRWVPSKTRD